MSLWWKRLPKPSLRRLVLAAAGLCVMMVAGSVSTEQFVKTACDTPLLVRYTPFPVSRLCPFPVMHADDGVHAAAVLHVHGPEDVAARRQALNAFLWRTAETP